MRYWENPVLGAERNAKVRHVVATGTAYQEILHTAQEAGSDLIVIGAHRPDLKDYLLGPNAARVVQTFRGVSLRGARGQSRSLAEV